MQEIHLAVDLFHTDIVNFTDAGESNLVHQTFEDRSCVVCRLVPPSWLANRESLFARFALISGVTFRRLAKGRVRTWTKTNGQAMVLTGRILAMFSVCSPILSANS